MDDAQQAPQDGEENEELDETQDPEPSEEPALVVPDEAEAFQRQLAALREQDQERYRKLQLQARSLTRAVTGWGTVPTKQEWERHCLEAHESYQSGRFLIERLGVEQYLDPTLMAVLWQLRQRLIEDLDVQGAHELMLVDLAVLAYYNGLRVQGWIGNAAMWTEHHFFAQESPTVKLERQYGRGSVPRLLVEEHVQRLVRELVPLLDRTNRMFIRNLRALKELRRPPTPAVAISQAGQVNVGTQQVNALGTTTMAGGGTELLADGADGDEPARARIRGAARRTGTRPRRGGKSAASE